ncbi:MAG: glycosyltransferase involved in cell wall biosynthesis [Ilumatobacter sp.]
MTRPPAAALRILFVTKGLDIGGIERMVVGLAIGLQQRGHHVEVALVNEYRDQLVPEFASTSVKVHQLRGTDRIGWRGAIGLKRLLQSKRFDVVHVHGPLPSIICRMVAGAPPIVTTSHTPVEALHTATQWGWRVTARRDAARIVVSEIVAQSMVGSSRVVPHGIDPAQAAAARNSAARADEVPGDEAVGICVASHRPAKNYPNLLRALAAARTAGARVRLIAIGEGPDLEDHRRIASELGVDDIVAFEPPTLDVLERIAGADFLIVASDWEGQPMVIAEALAVGTPVVSTAVGQAPTLVSRHVGRVVAPNDHVSLGGAIVELAGDRVIRSMMSAAALAQGSTWTLNDAVEAHARIYASVAAPT